MVRARMRGEHPALLRGGAVLLRQGRPDAHRREAGFLNSFARNSALVIVPSPPCGRGHRTSFNKLGWVRGKAKPPHPFFFVEPLSSPLPQRGEGTLTTAALSPCCCPSEI